MTDSKYFHNCIICGNDMSKKHFIKIILNLKYRQCRTLFIQMFL